MLPYKKDRSYHNNHHPIHPCSNEGSVSYSVGNVGSKAYSSEISEETRAAIPAAHKFYIRLTPGDPLYNELLGAQDVPTTEEAPDIVEPSDDFGIIVVSPATL